jgi:hypothetical protein
MNAAKECYLDITTAADPAAAVARLGDKRLAKIERWLGAQGFDTGFMAVAHGLVLLEQAKRWRRQQETKDAGGETLGTAIGEEGIFP